MKYYFFSISPYYKKICNKYELFIYLKRIYQRNKDSIHTEIKYRNLTNRINQSDINKSINGSFKDNRFYKHNNLYHEYNNKYKDEKFTIKLCNNLLIYDGNNLNKKLLNSLRDYSLFACDFKEQDYFWINEISC